MNILFFSLDWIDQKIYHDLAHIDGIIRFQENCLAIISVVRIYDICNR